VDLLHRREKHLLMHRDLRLLGNPSGMDCLHQSLHTVVATRQGSRRRPVCTLEAATPSDTGQSHLESRSLGTEPGERCTNGSTSAPFHLQALAHHEIEVWCTVGRWMNNACSCRQQSKPCTSHQTSFQLSSHKYLGIHLFTHPTLSPSHRQ